jgi:hypothetical protein
MSVVINDFSLNGITVSKVGGTGVLPKYFPRPLGPSIGVAPSTPSATNATGMLVVPGINMCNGQYLDVLAVGDFGNDTGDPSGSVTLRVQAVTPNAVTGSYTVNPVYTTLASSTAFVQTVGAVNSWAFKVSLFGSTNSGVVGGSYVAYINGALNNSTLKSTDNVLSGINFNSTPAPASLLAAAGGPGTQGGNATPFGLVVSVQFGTSDPTNTASMYEFSISS